MLHNLQKIDTPRRLPPPGSKTLRWNPLNCRLCGSACRNCECSLSALINMRGRASGAVHFPAVPGDEENSVVGSVSNPTRKQRILYQSLAYPSGYE